MGSLPDPLESVRERLRGELREAFERASAVERPADAEDESDFQPTLSYQQGVVAGLSAALDLIEGEIGRQQRIADEHVPGRVYS